MIAIGQAHKSVWIQSPYFIPDYSLYDTMIDAALAGVDVRFMMTGVPDKKIPFAAAQTYFKKLLDAGGRIYQYEAGFFHSKTIVVDDEICAVGTMNMDVRSLKLHKELMVWVFDQGFAHQVRDSFVEDMEHCHLVTMRTCSRWAAWRTSATRRRGCSPTSCETGEAGRMTPDGDIKVQVAVAPSRRRWAIAKRVVILGVTGIGLYVVWPSLASVFSSGPKLATISPLWMVPIVVAEVLSFMCMWALLKLALSTSEWFPVATAQLAGNAFSRIVPGGAAAGGAMQFDMLNRAGIAPTRAATSVTAVSLISTATLLGLPILSIPVILLSGAPVNRNLLTVGSIALAVCLAAIAGGAVHALRRQAATRPRRPVPGRPQPPPQEARAAHGTTREAGRRT